MEKLQTEVMEEVERQLAELPRREIAAKSLENSKLILVKDLDEALELTNAYAPEHLIIETENYMEVAERVINAGSVFLGSLTPESAGDYASGTNHTLPTNGYAKAYSGVSLDSFIRKITFQEILFIRLPFKKGAERSRYAASAAPDDSFRLRRGLSV